MAAKDSVPTVASFLAKLPAERRTLRRSRSSLLLFLLVVSACGDREIQTSVTTSTTPVIRPVARVGESVGLSGASISPDGRHLMHTD